MEYFQINPSVVHEQFGDETVVVNLDSGCYYSLQGTADTIWALAAGGISRSGVMSQVASTFQHDSLDVERETAAFLDALMSEGLLLGVAEPATSKPPPALAQGMFLKPVLQKYTDMEELLLLDPIHNVDDVGWPSAKPAD